MNWRTQIGTLLLFAMLMVSGGGCGRFTTSSVDEEKETHYLMGKKRLYSYDYRGAAEAFEKSLLVIPASAAAHLELGYLNSKQFGNYAQAIYHFEKMLSFQKDHPMAEQIRDHIHACKMAIASEVTLPPVNQRFETDMKALLKDNQRLTNIVSQLQGQISKLKRALAQGVSSSGTASSSRENAPSRTSPSNPRPTRDGELRTAATSQNATHPAPRQQRMFLKHVLRSGDTFYSLARQYRLQVNAIQKVNPGLRPKALKIGQVVNIPLSQTASAQ
ncbi:MAG: hypothetical protein M2R45_03902 [Verrucomicrobia subdivision 3 bacterium]|nr:hypothetical protein [Limisphaerales bacterium]MCS1412605.1 hypothetical protein [Limisphaerales bacterium]